MEEENHIRKFSEMDKQLIMLVQSQIRTGTVIVRIPAWMLEEATEDGLQEVHALIKINGCRVEIIS